MQLRGSGSTPALIALVVLGTVMPLPGCSQGSLSPEGPTRIPLPTPLPTPTPTPGPVPAPIDATTNASVAIEDASAIVHPDGARFGYEVRFLLRETGGRSGATVQRVVVYGPSGSDETGPGCWRDSLRVPPGGVLDTFHTDAGQYWLAYCSPGSGGVVRTPSLTITVRFADDDGRVGEVQSKIDRLR